MSASRPGQAPRRLPLGIWRIGKEAVSILAGNLSAISVLGFVPLLLLGLVEFLVGSGEFKPASGRTGLFENGTIAWPILLNWFLTNTFSVTVYGCLVRYVYDVKAGNPAGLVRSVAAALQVFVPLVICDFLTTLIALLGMMALVLPGLYLLALWCVLGPSIVLEQSGFQSFNRSAALTKDYRWPCVASVAAILLTQLLVSRGFEHQFLYLSTSENPWHLAAFIVADAAITCFFLSLGAAYYTLVYLRLRDIKDGTVWLADVFD